MKVDYAKLLLDASSDEKLFEFCKTHRLGLADTDDSSALTAADFGFHITVMYGKKTNESFIPGIFTVPPFVVEPVGFQAFGREQNLLALVLKPNVILSSLFDHYVRTYGYEPEFLPFQPHITVKGDVSSVWSRLDILPTPDFKLKLGQLVHQVKEK